MKKRPYIDKTAQTTMPQKSVAIAYPIGVASIPNAAAALKGATDMHLAGSPRAGAVTRLELGVMRAFEAFGSWCVELHKHVSDAQLNFQELGLLHCLRLRGGTPTLSEMLLFLHRHDLAALQYSFKKLESKNFVKKLPGASKRENAYAITEKARVITDEYDALRNRILIELCGGIVNMEEQLHDAAAVLERIIGIYDQATQAILNDHLLRR